jgi:TolB-like protein/tetratricopeptide (TPR) repeat protein
VASDYQAGPRPDAAKVPRQGSASVQAAESYIDALTRVLASHTLSRSPKSRAFLAYVVTEALAGRGSRLSERTVGRRALQRSGAFDGRFDAGVRVQATRVRKALQTYYAGEGASDPVRITLPPGGYVPGFELTSSSERSDDEGVQEASLDPRIVVRQFEFAGAEPARLISIAAAEAMVDRLSTFPGLQVVGPLPRDNTHPGVLARSLHARFVLDGTVVLQGGEATLNARLTDTSDLAVVWARSLASGADDSAGLALADAWASEVAGQIGDWTGVVFRRSRQSTAPPDGSEEQAAKLAFYASVEAGTRESLREARASLEAVVDSGSRSALVLTMLGHTIVTGVHYSLTEDRAGDVLRAEALVREALGQEPESAFAFLVLATCALMGGHWDLVRQHALRASELGPYHPTSLASAGLLLTYSGAWDQGVELLQRAFRLNPQLPSYARTLLSWDLLVSGDDAGALAHASVIHAPGEAWGPLCRALALAGLGHLEEARAELDAAVGIDPEIRDDPRHFFVANINLPESHVEHLVRRLRAALELLDAPAEH